MKRRTAEAEARALLALGYFDRKPEAGQPARIESFGCKECGEQQSVPHRMGRPDHAGLRAAVIDHVLNWCPR